MGNVRYTVIGSLLLGPRLYSALSQAHCLGAQCVQSAQQVGPGLFWVLTLLLFGCVLGYLSSALENIAAELCLTSSTNSNVHFPIPKVSPLQLGIIKVGLTHTRIVGKQS